MLMEGLGLVFCLSGALHRGVRASSVSVMLMEGARLIFCLLGASYRGIDHAHEMAMLCVILISTMWETPWVDMPMGLSASAMGGHTLAYG